MAPEAARVGAHLDAEGRCTFRTWAPHAASVELVIDPGLPRRDGGRAAERARRLRMEAPDGRGFHELRVAGVLPGTRYAYSLDGGAPLPDLASRWQPDGVHGASAVVEPRFAWSDDGWPGIPAASLVLYELHVGTRTREGTFDSLIGVLPRLRDLGVTGLEIMPVAEFPGSRNWGYDGVFPFAAQSTYGGPDGFRRLVDACHAHGLAVILDVVYNHLGPEGAVASRYGPYFTDRFKTPWGCAVNFDGEHSDGVRDFFLENARWWLEDCRVDGLRLDAVHEIVDRSAHPFLAELAEHARAIGARTGRTKVLIAESERNDRRLVEPLERNGLGMDAKWADDFHHAMHAAVTGERWGYHSEFGEMHQVLTTWRDGYFFTGQRSPRRKRRVGSATGGVPGPAFVAFMQNHDQVGNRPLGERLSALVPAGALRLCAASVLLSPFMPLLFMGEEHGERAPFPYFTSHGDPDLAEAVRKGRQAMTEPFGEDLVAPDPQSEETFRSAIVTDPEPGSPGDATWHWYRELIRLRKALPAFASGRAGLSAWLDGESTLVVRRIGAGQEAVIVLHHSGTAATLRSLPAAASGWRKELDSEDGRWGGGGREAPGTIADPTAPLALEPWAALVYVTP